MAEIHWMTSIKEALAQAKADNQLVLADFFNPG